MCTTLPSFAFEGDPAKYCWTHAEEGMINVVSKRCDHPGCPKRNVTKTVREYMKPSFDSKTATTDVVYLYYDGAEVREEMLM